MNREKLINDFNKIKGIKDFTKRCLLNESIYDFKGSIDIVLNYWQETKNVKEFTDKVLNDNRLINNQGYWELAKEQNNFTDILKKYLNSISDNHFNTISDIGSVSIGNESFKYNIHNKYGDTTNDIYIINEHKNLRIKFETTIEGNNINIYNYDIGGKSIYTLSGKYAIYVEPTIIVFVKWA